MRFKRRKRGISRLAIIERKCDYIIEQISILRTEVKKREDFDYVISRMHNAARAMLRSCETERSSAILELAKTIQVK